MASGVATDMMRECTVVHQLRIASGQIHCLYKSSLDIFYKDNTGVIRWVSSTHRSKDEMVSLLFDLSLLGHYVSEVKIVKFSFEYIIRLYFSQSEKLRTNLKTELMEQISQILDKMKR